MRKSVWAYSGVLLAFLILDGLWLGVLMSSTYKELFGPLMLASPNWGPAAVFYLLYVAGVVFFVVRPALAQGSARRAAVTGAFFGLIVALAGCWFGMRAGGGAAGVGRATTNAVVAASVGILAANFALTGLFF